MSHDAFRRALAKFDNNQSEMARAIGTNQQRISYVLNQGNPMPAELVLNCERATGITRYELRPDLYPRDEAEAA
jgi:DNA-binding transcriptional regulator YdaS (Cro superfamily)